MLLEGRILGKIPLVQVWSWSQLRPVAEPRFSGWRMLYWEPLGWSFLQGFLGRNETPRVAKSSRCWLPSERCSFVAFSGQVFSSGYFVPHGHLDLSEPHLGSSSYGAFEWRQACGVVPRGLWSRGLGNKELCAPAGLASFSIWSLANTSIGRTIDYEL